MSVRPPAVAGMFYPADHDRLVAALDAAFDDAVQPPPGARVPKALVAPHAGYVYSGAVAASAYLRVQPARDTIRRVVLPAAKPGLLAAVLLGVGRGFGETMAVLMASGHSINLPTSVFDSVRALTATIAAELGETAVGSEHYRALFTLGIFLFVITFVINLTADLVVRGIKKK